MTPIASETQISTKSFIETQFPVSKVSKESYKERKSNYSQTLTGLGKWWGRKPLILVRATILGLVMPASDNPQKDREVFLKILTMDDEGLWQRKNKAINQKELYQLFTPRERKEWFTDESTAESPKLRRGLTSQDKESLQKLAFGRLSYDEKLAYCCRPEHIEGPSRATWNEINTHLNTQASSIQELIQELGIRAFGREPNVGDAFCGGGSIPFEAARIGCNVYASDLNPVAALLTWASLNIVGGNPEFVEEVKQAQEEIYKLVDEQIVNWGIENNSKGWRADAYLYCLEVKCPECNWSVPLAPSWVIGEKTNCIAKLVPNDSTRSYTIEIHSGVSSREMIEAKASGTAQDGLACPNCKQSTPLDVIRGDRRSANGTEYGLRQWENEDLTPRPEDILQERLYCIRWVDKDGKRYYRSVEPEDLERENRVLEILRERFSEWQEKGIIPNRRIEPGDKTDEPIRTRGWTYWHHLFNPRQLLTNGLFFELISSHKNFKELIPSAGKLLDWNSRLCKWTPASGSEKTEQTFLNQALNTYSNYGCRSLLPLERNFKIDYSNYPITSSFEVVTEDARRIDAACDLWITDPPYADAINYHELSEFFLAWYESSLQKVFKEWSNTSKRALAVVGNDHNFRQSMVACYRNLSQHLSENGFQVVMFTHQDSAVWSDLCLILWSAGLRVHSAWCIVTESDTALREGNYVQGTVLLILKKQTSEDTAFLDELHVQVEREVKRQLQSMLELEDQEDPNFSDTDYQLAAYAAALRVLTQYKTIEDFDIAYELNKPRTRNEVSPIEAIIIDAVKVACDFLVPKSFDSVIWRMMSAEERFYLKGLDIESHGEYRSGAYQELARGFGIREYRGLQANTRANQTRLKTASELERRSLGDDPGFASSLVRHALFAIREVGRTGETLEGKNWLRNEVRDYWNQRKTLIEIFNYLGQLGHSLEHWQQDSQSAILLKGALENDYA